MIEFIQSITDAEMNFIANLDYGCGKEEHLQALKKVIFEQGGICNNDQLWYPAEVYELGSNSLQQGHEREFVICTLLVILNVIKGYGHIELSEKFDHHAWAYDQLPENLKGRIIQAYEQAKI